MRIKGLVMICVGSILWGITGPVVEWFLTEKEISIGFLLAIRLTLAGMLLLLLLCYKKVNIFIVFHDLKSIFSIILFGLIGMLGVQFSYAATIQASNAVTATLLQFLAPIFIMAFVAIRMKVMPSMKQFVGITGTLFGLFLLLTNGQVDELMISYEALLFGVVLAFTFTFYTLYPIQLMKKYDVLLIVGWGMLIAGIFLIIFYRVWQSSEWQALQGLSSLLMLVVLIIGGSLAFILTLGSLKYITPVENSILSSLEPLSAMIFSFLLFGHTLQLVQLIGSVCMLGFVTWLSIMKE